MTPVRAAHNLLGLAGFTAAIAGIWLVARIASLNVTLQRIFVAMLLGWMFVTAWRELQGTADRHAARSA